MKRLLIVITVTLSVCLAFSVSSEASLHKELSGEGTVNIQVTPSVRTQTLTVDLNGGQPKPGQKAKANVVSIDVPAELVFESPFSVGTVRLSNPVESTMAVVYQLRVSVAELRRQAGFTGYSEEQYKALSAEEGFDPERAYVILSQTKTILPGEWVEEIILGSLPDGRTLPAGSYTAELVMVPLGGEAQRGVLLSAVVTVPFIVENDLIVLEVKEQAVDLSAFNPVDAAFDLVYSVQISQSELERVSGSPHQDAQTMAVQASTSGFDSDYEFISLFESEAIAPGAYLEGVLFHALPDGASLPSGEYLAWLVRYAVLEGELVMLDVNTQLHLLVL